MVTAQLHICSRCPHGWLNPLGELGSEVQYVLAQERRVAFFPPRSTIVCQGEPVSSLYCISRGTAKAVLPYSERSAAADLLISLLKPGDIIGLRDLFGKRCHTVSVIALEEVQACVLPAPLIEQYARHYPQFWVRVAQVLAREIESIEEQFLLFQRRSVRERVLHLLLLLLRTYGTDEQGYIRFSITPSIIAELLQSSVSAIRRILLSLERRHLIRSEPNRIRILDADTLRHLLSREVSA